MSTTTKKDLIDRIADQTRQKRTIVKKTVKFKIGRLMKDALEGRLPNGALASAFAIADDDDDEVTG